MFNLVYTALPIIVFGLCEQNVEAKVFQIILYNFSVALLSSRFRLIAGAPK